MSQPEEIYVPRKMVHLRRKVHRLLHAAFVDSETVQLAFEKLGCARTPISWKSAVRMANRDQLIAALRVLNYVKGCERSAGQSTRSMI